ncbi:CGCGG family putative rSAM-modified RiPP protein [Candidatus Pyrohabitans sp.]
MPPRERKRFSWSLDLEGEEYEEDIELLLREAKAAIESTSTGYSVNLVTPASLGMPDSLIEELKREYGEKIMAEYVDQCECGGYVTRVTVLEE